MGKEVQKRLGEPVFVNASLGNNDDLACVLTQLGTSLVFFI